jgi:nucleotide-binding universal stress UspA family protein
MSMERRRSRCESRPTIARRGRSTVATASLRRPFNTSARGPVVGDPSRRHRHEEPRSTGDDTHRSVESPLWPSHMSFARLISRTSLCTRSLTRQPSRGGTRRSSPSCTYSSTSPRWRRIDFRIQEGGFAHNEIVAQIDALHADLLVLGTHGRSGFQRLFLGSVSEKVIRKAVCPTLIVPPRAPDVATDAPVQFHRILCPIDFSDSSLDALEHAINLAEEADARLTLLHVVEIPRVLSDEPAVDIDMSAIREGAATEARRKLHGLVPDQARTYCTVDTAVVEGRAYREILRHATEGRADLIVMGGHGRGALDLLVFGSTTHHVVRSASCPVLIIRRRQ